MTITVLQSSATLAIRGILALLFGIAALLLPAAAFLALVISFTAYALVDGVFALAAAVTRRNGDGRGWLEGVAGILVGIVTMFRAGITAVALIYLIASWALLTGMLKIILAIQLRRKIRGEWMLALSGVASIILSALIVLTPLPETLALIWALGSYAIVVGGLLIAPSVRVRNWERSFTEQLRGAA
jgi:uncharacterized membrane protein HdeD (DUF308 family)